MHGLFITTFINIAVPLADPLAANPVTAYFY